jgi:hypothetical protein
MFERYDILANVTKDFACGMGATSTSNTSSVQSSGNKRKADSISSMAGAIVALGNILQETSKKPTSTSADEEHKKEERAAALRKEVIELWRQSNAETCPELKEFLLQERERVMKKLNGVEGITSSRRRVVTMSTPPASHTQ